MTKPLDPIEAVTATQPQHARASGGACQNCYSMLQGSYCHVCGQHAHNPLKSFRHAVEDVFESFWHVDGRIFRTLRDLLVPGRIARGYLDGHRVRYIPPLRLYVILSLITFFVAHLVTANLKGGFQTDGGNTFAAYTRAADVTRVRDEKLAEIERALQEARKEHSAVGISATNAAREAIRAQAAQRIDELSGKSTPSSGGILQIHTSAPTPAAASAAGNVATASTADKLARTAEANARLFAKDKRAFAERILTHTPATLLVLVPLFALVLRIVYLLRPLGYLEHLVVALYSHAFLLLVALAWMLMLMLDRALGTTLLGAFSASVFPLLVPLYLFFSQKNVYRENGWRTLLRFAVTAMLYFVLAIFAAAAVIGMALLLKP